MQLPTMGNNEVFWRAKECPGSSQGPQQLSRPCGVTPRLLLFLPSPFSHQADAWSQPPACRIALKGAKDQLQHPLPAAVPAQDCSLLCQVNDPRTI